MKKIIALFCAMLILISFPITALANDETAISSYVEYLDDGSYIVTENETRNISVMATSTKSHVKTSTYYNADNEKLWSITLTGTFTYTGSSATCTKSTATYTIYNSRWKVTSAVASKSGRKAVGDFTAKLYTLGIPVKTVTRTLTISCSNTGVCS